MTFRPETAESIPMGVAILAAGRTCPDVEHLLGPDGPIAKHMPNWEDRPQQRQLAQCTRRAFRQRLHSLTEGGCGTGKSVANLVPAILHALETKRPVLVSTHTLALQAQYCDKDLPQLQQLLTPWLTEKFGRTFTFAKQLGRGNYLCEAKPYDQHPEVVEWRETTADGDLGTLPLDGRTRAAVTSTKEECAGSRCRLADSCWFMGAKRAVREADVVVVNHALLMTSLLRPPGTVLPVYDVCVIDEAHHLQDEATKILGVEVGPAKVSRLAARALQFCGAHRQGVLGFDDGAVLEDRADCNWCNGTSQEHETDCPMLTTMLTTLAPERTTSHSPTQEAIDAEVQGLFRALKHAHRAVGNQGEALLQSLEHTEAGEHLDELCAHLRRLAVDTENVGDQHWEESTERVQAGKMSESLRELAAQLFSLRTPQPGRVARFKMDEHPSLHSEPIDVADFLKDSLWKTPCALSSATLAAGTGDKAFEYLQESLGIHTLHQVVVGSPFRWEEQALLYLPEEGNLEANLGMKATSAHKREECGREYARVQALHLKEVLDLTKGRALLLFTSQKGLDQTREALLAKGLRWPHVTQSEMSRADAIEWFRTTPNAVLFGLASFFEGVDIVGDALSLLYIDKLPFPSPTDLLWQAKLDRAGGGPGAFQRLSVPRAIVQMKQGVGRLIRSAWDRGVVVLGDPRLQTKAYGATILAALPPARRITRAQLRHIPFFLAQAGVPCERPDLVGAVMALDPARMTPEHAGWWKRIRERAPLLPSGLWRVGEWLCKRYGNDSKTILKGE